jgi:hypothetical protein
VINPLSFDHLPYIAAAYGLFFAVTAWLVVGARMRLALVTRRLKAADPRTRDGGRS